MMDGVGAVNGYKQAFKPFEYQFIIINIENFSRVIDISSEVKQGVCQGSYILLDIFLGVGRITKIGHQVFIGKNQKIGVKGYIRFKGVQGAFPDTMVYLQVADPLAHYILVVDLVIPVLPLLFTGKKQASNHQDYNS